MDEDWRRLLAEQTTDIIQIKNEVHAISKYVRRRRLWGYITTAVAIITIVGGIIYLPPFINNLINQIFSVIHK